MPHNWNDFNWTEFYYIASFLCNNCNSNDLSERAKIRCGISRAYYAAFHQAKKYATLHLHYHEPTDEERKQMRLKGECYNDHYKLLTFYRESENANEVEIGSKLSNLKNFRVICDYKNDESEVIRIHKNLLQDSRDIIYDLGGDIER